MHAWDVFWNKFEKFEYKQIESQVFCMESYLSKLFGKNLDEYVFNMILCLVLPVVTEELFVLPIVIDELLVPLVVTKGPPR